MRMWSIIAAAGLLLAGCAEPGDTEPVLDDQVGADGLNETVDAAPVAILEADLLNGTAPLFVTFTLGATDAEGNLSWVFAVNGTEVANGTDVPTTLNHTFAAGNHTVSFTVSDGQASNTTDLAIVVEAGVVEAPFDPIEYSGWVTAPCNQCYTAGSMDVCVGFQAGLQELDCLWFELPEEAIGREYVTTSTGEDADVAFYSSCAPGNQVQFVGQGGHDAGTVPEGAGCIIIVEWTMPDSMLTVTIA